MKQKLLNISSFSHIQKAYQEGIYADTPANKKLGRVGMTYTAYNDYIQRKKEGEDVDLDKYKGSDLLSKNEALLKNSLKNIDTFNSKTISLTDGGKIIVEKNKKENYKVTITNSKGDIEDLFNYSGKENLIRDLNSYLYESDLIIGEKETKKEESKDKTPISRETISFDNKNAIDIFRENKIFSNESGMDIPILDSNKKVIGYIQKRQFGLDEGSWSWDFSFEKDKPNPSGRYETKKEAIDNFISQYNSKISGSELDKIKEKAQKDGTFMKAPNGNPSQLNEKQWLQVRTKSFKDWFGDWESKSKTSSKVVDKNGEPLVVYHGTNRMFQTFNLDKGATPQFWFTDRKDKIESGEVGAAGSGYIMPVFLNIKEPAGWEEEDNLVLDQIIQEGFDGKIFDDEGEITYVAFEPNQIKSANNKGTFSNKNNNIYE